MVCRGRCQKLLKCWRILKISEPLSVARARDREPNNSSRSQRTGLNVIYITEETKWGFTCDAAGDFKYDFSSRSIWVSRKWGTCLSLCLQANRPTDTSQQTPRLLSHQEPRYLKVSRQNIFLATCNKYIGTTCSWPTSPVLESSRTEDLLRLGIGDRSRESLAGCCRWVICAREFPHVMV